MSFINFCGTQMTEGKTAILVYLTNIAMHVWWRIFSRRYFEKSQDKLFCYKIFNVFTKPDYSIYKSSLLPNLRFYKLLIHHMQVSFCPDLVRYL